MQRESSEKVDIEKNPEERDKSQNGNIQRTRFKSSARRRDESTKQARRGHKDENVDPGRQESFAKWRRGNLIWLGLRARRTQWNLGEFHHDGLRMRIDEMVRSSPTDGDRRPIQARRHGPVERDGFEIRLSAAQGTVRKSAVQNIPRRSAGSLPA